jgi:murein DD-endopeptidase MepM/ murein hydrolase activator NlpD
MKRFPIALLIACTLVSFGFTKKPSKPAISKSLVFPVAGYRSNIGSFWGDVRDGGKRKHRGIDIFARKGTPVVAISDGIIVAKGNTPRGGKTLWLQSTSHPWTVYYAHLDEHKVRRGQIVKKGQVIGTVGKTGNARTTPPHLHFGIYTWKGAVNPLPYVKNSPKVAAPKLVAQKQPAARKQRVVVKK